MTNMTEVCLDNQMVLFGGGVDSNVLEDGGKILGHVLVGK
jgi:hypothetical protein